MAIKYKRHLDCGCYTRRPSQSGVGRPIIEHCALHVAAPELLAACQLGHGCGYSTLQVAAAILAREGSDGAILASLLREKDAAEVAAIARAEGK